MNGVLIIAVVLGIIVIVAVLKEAFSSKKDSYIKQDSDDKV